MVRKCKVGKQAPAHHDQLRRVIEEHSDPFHPEAEAEGWRGGQRLSGSLQLFRISRKN